MILSGANQLLIFNLIEITEKKQYMKPTNKADLPAFENLRVDESENDESDEEDRPIHSPHISLSAISISFEEEAFREKQRQPSPWRQAFSSSHWFYCAVVEPFVSKLSNVYHTPKRIDDNNFTIKKLQNY